MKLIRIIIGFICLAIATVITPVMFDYPKVIFFVMLFSVLGLWALGYTTKFAPQSAQEKYIREQIAIRQSKGFDWRNRIMGIIAILLGLGVLYAVFNSKPINTEALLGGVMFVVLGFWYALKGKSATEFTYNDIIQKTLLLIENTNTAKELKEQSAILFSSFEAEYKKWYFAKPYLRESKKLLNAEINRRTENENS